MSEITEILIGELSLKSPDDRLSFLVNKINDVVKPPRQLIAQDVNIRAMYVLNDLVNSHGGKFDRQDFSKLCDLLVDTPVLIGHDRKSPPVARTFHAELEERGNVLWIKSYFYWPKVASDEKDDLLVKIDSGIFKECSISFIYAYPECSICGQDFRDCPHHERMDCSEDEPHFIYRGVAQILETSLVCKGSVKGTCVTDKLYSEFSDCVLYEVDGHVKKAVFPQEILSTGKASVVFLSCYADSLRIISYPSSLAVSVAKWKDRFYIMAKSSS